MPVKGHIFKTDLYALLMYETHCHKIVKAKGLVKFHRRLNICTCSKNTLIIYWERCSNSYQSVPLYRNFLWALIAGFRNSVSALKIPAVQTHTAIHHVWAVSRHCNAPSCADPGGDSLSGREWRKMKQIIS